MSKILVSSPRYYDDPEYPELYKSLLARLKFHPRLSNAEKNLIDLLYMTGDLSNLDFKTLERAATIADAYNPINTPPKDILHG